MNHAHEVAAISERLELLYAARHVALNERNDGLVWLPAVGTLSRQLTAGADVFQLMRELDRSPVKSDVLSSVADLDLEISRLRQRLAELRP
jgi:hypothetical protein